MNNLHLMSGLNGTGGRLSILMYMDATVSEGVLDGWWGGNEIALARLFSLLSLSCLIFGTVRVSELQTYA